MKTRKKEEEEDQLSLRDSSPEDLIG